MGAVGGKEVFGRTESASSGSAGLIGVAGGDTSSSGVRIEILAC